MKLCIRFLFLLCFTSIHAFSQQVMLQGNAEQFAAEDIYIRKVSNPITGTSEIVDTITVRSDGSFSETLELAKPGWIFFNSGVFRVRMFLEPGMGYVLKMPPKTKKTESDIRNPFYKPVMAHIQVLCEYPLNTPQQQQKEKDINSRIFRFDTLINATSADLMAAVWNSEKVNADSIIEVIENEYTSDSSEYFKNYRNLRYGILKINSRDVGLQPIYEKYLNSIEPQTDNPAFMGLFNEMYKEFLFYYSRTPDGKEIKQIVNRYHNLSMLKDSLVKHPAIPDPVYAELIIIKEVFDIYFKDYFYREALLMLLDSIAEAPEIPIHARYAEEVKTYLTRLKTGNFPPAFELLDQHGESKKLDDFKGKYVYVNFCTPDNYSCLKEFPFLNALYKVHMHHLEIVTIMVTEEIGAMVDFMQKNNYGWTALFYGNSEQLLADYDVRAFPTSYLLDKEGRIVQSPAVLATEGLEEQLFRIMRSRGDL